MIGNESTLFNLLLNPIFSFTVGILIVFSGVRIFRIGDSGWKLALLSLPFVKILYDLLRGIPTTSFLGTGLNPFNLPPLYKALNIGAGLSKFGPVFSVTFSANDLSGGRHSISIPDFAWGWLEKHYGADTPFLMLSGILSISAALLLRRLISCIFFELKRRQYRRTTDEAMEVIPIGFRKVDVYRSKFYEGSPFTGGILRPYVCIPASTEKEFTADELRAVIQHELAHVRHHDLAITLVIKILGDLFWFVPGYRFLSRKIDQLREILADETATHTGTSQACLASALIKLKRTANCASLGTAVYSAFYRESSLIARRISRLVDEEGRGSKARFGWNHRFIRPILLSWICGAVMLASLGGNHEITPSPKWMDELLKLLGGK